MNSAEETAVRNTVIINIQDGDVVVKGRDDSSNVRVVGQGQVNTQNGNTVVNARGSVVVDVPRNSNIELLSEGVQDVALKSLASVRLADIQGSLAASDLENLTAGHVQGDASVKGLRGDLTLEDVNGDLAVKDARTVSLHSIHGHAEFKAVDSIRFEDANGHLKVKESRMVQGDKVNGHAVLKDVEQVKLNEVHGHLEVKSAQDVTVDHVNGHVELKDVRGAVRIEHVEGNLDIKGIGTSFVIEEVQGEVAIRGTWQPGGEYSFSAQGEVEINADGAAHITFKTEGEVATGEGCEVQQDPDGTVHVYLGDQSNAATVNFEAEGDVTINVRDEEHNHRWHHRQQRQHRQWNREWQGGWEGEFGNGPDIDREVRRAMEEVRSEMHRATENVRHEIERAMREVDTHARGPVGDVIRGAMRDLMNSLRDKPGTSSAKVETPVAETPVNDTTDEVKIILQMIAEGKITPEQGEQLLQAMGDK